MLTADLTNIASSLDKLASSASFAAKYGPFFFAVALLVVTPFVALAIFKKFLNPSSAARKSQPAYEDFRFYFRGTVTAGLLCVAVGVGWWVFDNYSHGEDTRNNLTELQQRLVELQNMLAEMQYTRVGVIVNGADPTDEILPYDSRGMSIYFGRIPSTGNLFFAVLSNTVIPSDLNVTVLWGQRGIRMTPIPLKMILAKNPKEYRLKFDPQGLGALIQPLQ